MAEVLVRLGRVPTMAECAYCCVLQRPCACLRPKPAPRPPEIAAVTEQVLAATALPPPMFGVEHSPRCGCGQH